MKHFPLGWTIALSSVVALVVSGGTAAGTIALLNAGAPPAGSVDGVSIAGFPSGGNNAGIFTDTCSTTDRTNNDPIMMPSMTGMSMDHDFFGNTAPSASSTPVSLVGGKSTCTTSADASAYWTPVVYQNGHPLTPSSSLIYWRAPAASARAVHTMPTGITMIAGDEDAKAPQSDKVIDWTCTKTATDPTPQRADAPHDCAQGSRLRLVITFPNCWDGRTLNGKGTGNVVYQDSSGACPSGHSTQIPQIVFHVSYSTSGGAGITLSTGPGTQGPSVTSHADFMNGWTEATMTRDVTACIDTQTRCGRTSGPEATPAGGKQRP